jgi:2-polyprenyl-3-methyl-5-hydroxy-6-metoxy-1,4-benzoquinol methylase
MTEPKASSQVVTETYWSAQWASNFDAKGIVIEDRGWRGHVDRTFDRLFNQVLQPHAGHHLIEIGCARSRWLPYFAQRFQFSVTGLDYSAAGCRQAQDIARSANVEATIIHGDLFDPPNQLLGAFDVVLSWGLVEHFIDQNEIIGGLENFLQSGGMLITVIPNMRGAPGWLQKWVARDIYDVHVPLTREDLRATLEARGHDVVYCDHIVSTNFWVVNEGTKASGVARLVLKGLRAFSALVWKLESATIARLPMTRLLSPYVICISKLRDTSGS